MVAQVFLPQPPRKEGREVGPRELLDWAWRFFQALGVDSRVLIAADQYRDPGTIDTADLPAATDRDAVTISSAQAVANAAMNLALAIVANTRTGTFTASDLTIGTTITFGTKMPDANYKVALTRVGATGAPAAGSDEIATV